jgi:hypothetical protein
LTLRKHRNSFTPNPFSFLRRAAMATNSVNETRQPEPQENPHPTPVTSYVGLLIGFMLFLAMIVLQAQAGPLM